MSVTSSRAWGLGPALVPILAAVLSAQSHDVGELIRTSYTKREVRMPMRDGVHLHTAIYEPVDRSRPYPILMRRTPYGCKPYGNELPTSRLGPSEELVRDGYVFVHQDVRGCYMSEGDFINMTPHLATKRSPTDVDESSDTHDTITWLLDHVENTNGRVGMWGISYPGFYAAAGMIDAHPALAAVSPQAPVADWYFDDFHHHGAFFLAHAFNFLSSFGPPRQGLTTESNPRFEHGTPDGYAFFLDLGPLGNAARRHLGDRVPFWTATTQHPDYDVFWEARNILPHLANVAPAVMVVGGWFDAEDLYGPLQIYRSVEARNPGIFNSLVMGPWRHGGWSRDDGDRLGNARFGSRTSVFYRRAIERRFFNHFLKGEDEHGLAEAQVFETGANRWRRFDAWPPRAVTEANLWLRADGALALEPPDEAEAGAFDEYVSDPTRPVPYTEVIDPGMTREYMTDDQRFASRRPDVLTYRTDALTEAVTLAGPIVAELSVSTSGTASDWIVKVIDVFPDDAKAPDDVDPPARPWGGYQMMVRSEVIRGRYRESYAAPRPFAPNVPTAVRLPLQDVLHTFKAGHRIMIQIQSTWFPLVDRNPHRYVANVFEATPADFIPAVQRVYRGGPTRTRLVVGVLGEPGDTDDGR